MKNSKNTVVQIILIMLALLGMTSIASATGPTAPDLTSVTDYVEVLVPAIVTLGGTIVVAALGWMGFKFAARQGVGFFKSIGSK